MGAGLERFWQFGQRRDGLRHNAPSDYGPRHDRYQPPDQIIPAGQFERSVSVRCAQQPTWAAFADGFH